MEFLVHILKIFKIIHACKDYKSSNSSGGYIYKSLDAGLTWKEDTNYKPWRGIASSYDGKMLAAAESGNDGVSGGYIWTSGNTGLTWTKQSDTGPQLWRSIASSADGVLLAACTSPGYIWTSANAGVTWVNQTCTCNAIVLLYM